MAAGSCINVILKINPQSQDKRDTRKFETLESRVQATFEWVSSSITLTVLMGKGVNTVLLEPSEDVSGVSSPVFPMKSDLKTLLIF